MTNGKIDPRDAAALRRLAEERFAPPPERQDESLRLLHELQVHQVELELQNAELRETRHELETLLDKYTDLFDFAPVGYVTLDRTGTILNVNLTAARLLGLERYRIKGRQFRHFVDHPDRPSFSVFLQKVFGGENQDPCEVELVAKGGFRVSLQLKGLATDSGQECRMTLVDITELKRVKRDLSDSQKHKMELLGQLAGGIAHNFNNNLAIILGNVDLAKSRLPAESAALPQLANVKTAAFRARDLVKQIMNYSRQGSVRKVPISLPVLIDETLGLLEAITPSTVILHRPDRTAGGDLTIEADAGQIQEALLNLCTNAVQAMNEKGALTLSLDRVDLGAEDFIPPFEPKPGSYARVGVHDTGSGMSPETLEQIFDPFFSTKDASQGTGMGLASVQGIVMQHAGLLKVVSVQDEGSGFDLYFPLVENREPAPRALEQTLPRGSEKILLVDDDSVVAESCSQILRDYGYQVTEQQSSINALARFREDPQFFDLVITDQTMPGLSGQELITELHRLRPELPTILCTGYSNVIDAEAAKAMGISAFCLKPLSLAEMVQTTRSVLDAAK